MKDFNINNSNIDRTNIYESTLTYFKVVYPSFDLSQKFQNFKNVFTKVFNNSNKDLEIKHFLGGKQISSKFNNPKRSAGDGGEIITEEYLNKIQNVYNVIKEPNGEGTHPDFQVNLNYKDILLEVKTIYCNEFSKDDKLLIKVNNATNSEGAVRQYLNEYKKYVYDNQFDVYKFMNEHDINDEARQFFETFVVFYYYYIDDEKNCINYFDIEIIPLPVVISFMLSDDGYLIYDKDNNVKLTVKSAGETSQNNNVNLALTLRSIFDKKELIINPLMLYLLGHTYKNLDHVRTNKEIKRNEANQFINELTIDLYDLNNSTSVLICQQTINKIKTKYKYCSKNKYLLNENIFEQYKIDYVDAKNLFNKKCCILEFIDINNMLSNNKLLTSIDINNFKIMFKELRKRYKKLNKNYNITQYDNLYDNQYKRYKSL